MYHQDKIIPAVRKGLTCRIIGVPVNKDYKENRGTHEGTELSDIGLVIRMKDFIGRNVLT